MRIRLRPPQENSAVRVLIRRSAVGGFTLIELLVVVAIIAVLVALAFSAGKSALLSAKSAQSLANLKQIGALVGNYAADNNNRLPLSAYWPSTFVFQNILVAHFKDLQATQYNPKAKLYLPGMFYDPVLKGKNEHPWGSFGVNSAVVLDNNRYSGGTASGVGIPLSKIRNPSKKVMCASAIQPGYASTWGFDGEVFASNGFDPSYGPDLPQRRRCSCFVRRWTCREA